MQRLRQGLRAVLGETVSPLLPLPQAELLRWCLGHGFRAVKPVTLMSRGAYRDPVGNWYPSILY